MATDEEILWSPYPLTRLDGIRERREARERKAKRKARRRARDEREWQAKWRTYAIAAVGIDMIKIGRAMNVQARLLTLQTGSPVRLEVIGSVAGDHERLIHERFSAHRSHGEWFHASHELIAFLAEMGISR